MFTTTTRNRLAAAALALGGLGLAAPAMAAPLGPDAGLYHGPDGIVAVQYGYGGDHRGWNRHGFGPGRHHGWDRGRHFGWDRGRHFGWRHHGPGYGPRHHGWGHRHGYGRW